MEVSSRKGIPKVHHSKVFPWSVYLLVLIVPLLLSACSSSKIVPEEDLEIGQSPGEYYAPNMASYKIQSGDILDIIYEFTPKLIDSYKLQILDKVKVTFPANEKLSSIQTIRTDGRISLPYLRDIKIVGLTPSQATDKIRKAYAPILRRPSVYISVEEFGAGTAELKKVITTAPRGQSKLVLVRPDGFATFPIIGEVKVINRTVPEVRDEVNKRYSELYQELSVDVLLEKTSGNYIYVLGRVKKPGAYIIKRPLFVGEALALAGGLADDAGKTGYLAHLEGRTIKKVPLDLAKLENGDISIMKLVKPNDFIYVSRSGLSKAAMNMEFLRKMLLFRGFGVGASYDINNQD